MKWCLAARGLAIQASLSVARLESERGSDAVQELADSRIEEPEHRHVPEQEQRGSLRKQESAGVRAGKVKNRFRGGRHVVEKKQRPSGEGAEFGADGDIVTMSTTDSEAGAGGGSTADLQLPSEEGAAVGAEGDASFLEGCCSDGGTETETSTAPATPSWLDPRTLIRNSMKKYVGQVFDKLWKQYREAHEKNEKRKTMDDLARKEKKIRKEMKKQRLPADLADWSAKQNKSHEDLAKQTLSYIQETKKVFGTGLPLLWITYLPQFITESKNFKSGSKGRAWVVREVRKDWFAHLKPGQGLIDLTADWFPPMFLGRVMKLMSICEPFDDLVKFNLTDEEDCASELKQDAAPKEKSLQATVEEVLSETIGSSFLADEFKKLRKKMDEERKKAESQSGDDSSAKTTHESK